ncbi:hypothetical protein VTN77DRAFT_565 [Rasamsonia byssochlamydoides]|uniref:uncharacterized protein n=1 Tax=Rasamsonia byssochlamydoides TaxID=89139 RepID=UPI00374498C6
MGLADIEKTNPSTVDAAPNRWDLDLPSAKVDAALEFLQSEGIALATFSTINERILVRKIDYMIMPLMWACYNLQYLDKTILFANLALAFYVTYLVFELPTGYLMQRFPTAKYLGLNVILWGVMTTLNCTASTFGGLMTLRILLGIFESAIAPALILITSMWYKRHEQPIRMATWYIGTGTASIMGALVAYGLLFYSADKFRSWQLLFLIFGLITIIVGITVVLFLPDNPMSSRLSHDEKILAIERLRENKTGIENKHFKKEQFYEVFKDPQTYLIAVIVAAMDVPNAAGSSFSALIIQSFGFTTEQTELLSIPGGVISVVSILVGNYIAGRTNQRCLVATASLTAGLLGGCLMAFGQGQAVRLAGNYLMSCSGPALPLMYALAGANVAGHTKKVTMNAVLLMSFCLGNILGPLTFRTKDQPEYMPAKIAIVATTSVAIVFSLALLLYYRFENRRRDRDWGCAVHQENSEFLDLTDRQNREFRYTY